MLAPPPSCNKPGLRFSAFKLCQIMAPPLLLSLYNYVAWWWKLYIVNLTYIICNAIMLECMASLLSRLSSYTHILKLLQRFSRIQTIQFFLYTMDRSHTLKHFLFNS